MEKIVRTEAEAALDDVVESCKAAADHHHAAADVAPADLKELFAELGRQRRRWAQELEEEVKQMGNLPSAPDADLEALDQIVTRIRAAFSRDEHAALLERGRKAEEELAAHAQAALREDLPSSARAVLREIEAGTAAARRELSG